MRILHTSDWHLGRELAGHSRAAEHQRFLDELVTLAAEVDLVVVSGDVFDATNPPIGAEELYFDAIARLGDGGRRAVVVVAGNHDSPDRLEAPAPLAARHGVFVLGRPGAVAAPWRGPAGRVAVSTGPGWLEIATPSGETAVVAALPYPSEARLRESLTNSPRTGDRQVAYEARLREAWRPLVARFRPGTVNLATSHLAVRSCAQSESERALVGGAYHVHAAALPAGAHYLALGHLHAPQAVPDAPSPTRYAGAPLAFRMSERDVSRSHCLVEAAPGREARIRLIPVAAGRPLVRWEVRDLAEVFRGVESGAHADALIELVLHADSRLDPARLAQLKRLPRDFVRIRVVLPEALRPQGPARRELPVRELFRAFHREQTGAEAPDALVELFLELAAAAAPDEVTFTPGTARESRADDGEPDARSGRLPVEERPGLEAPEVV